MYYKLTDRDMQTHNGFQWEPGVWYSIDKEERGYGLCSESWFHCYDDKLLAVLFNPVHANIKNPRLFRCRVRGKRLVTVGDKYGFTQMVIPHDAELGLPVVTITQRVAFGILCAKEVCDGPEWNEWADAWLDGSDRSREAAWAAARAARAAAWAAARAVCWRVAGNIAYNAACAATDALLIKPIDLKLIAQEAMEY